jgi:hypothetical protein
LVRSFPPSSPCKPLSTPLKAIARGFIDLFHICLWSPSTIFPHFHVFHSLSHKYPPTHYTYFTIPSFIINFKFNVQRGLLMCPHCEYTLLWSVQHLPHGFLGLVSWSCLTILVFVNLIIHFFFVAVWVQYFHDLILHAWYFFFCLILSNGHTIHCLLFDLLLSFSLLTFIFSQFIFLFWISYACCFLILLLNWLPNFICLNPLCGHWSLLKVIFWFSLCDISAIHCFYWMVLEEWYCLAFSYSFVPTLWLTHLLRQVSVLLPLRWESVDYINKVNNSSINQVFNGTNNSEPQHLLSKVVKEWNFVSQGIN